MKGTGSTAGLGQETFLKWLSLHHPRGELPCELDVHLKCALPVSELASFLEHLETQALFGQ